MNQYEIFTPRSDFKPPTFVYTAFHPFLLSFMYICTFPTN